MKYEKNLYTRMIHYQGMLQYQRGVYENAYRMT